MTAAGAAHSGRLVMTFLWSAGTPQRIIHPSLKPKGFGFSLRLPFVITKGNNLQSNPSSVQIHGTASHPLDSTNDPNAKNAHAPELKFPLSFFVAITTQQPLSRNVSQDTTVKRPEGTGFILNSDTTPANPQSRLSQSGSEWSLNSAGSVQQQTQQQTYQYNLTSVIQSLNPAYDSHPSLIRTRSAQKGLNQI